MNAKELDQFYTSPDCAKHCYDVLDNYLNGNLTQYSMFEPCVGTGSFYNLMPKNQRYGVDIDPKVEGVLQSDFFDVNEIPNGETVVLSNPPFGKNSSLAIQFFNKCATFDNVSVIAFIVPRTFEKVSVANRLDLYFTLDYNEVLPIDSFIFEGCSYNVPCVFQIWKRTETKRSKTPILKQSAFFEFVDKKTYDEQFSTGMFFAMKRVGGTAGKLRVGYDDFSSASTYFIKSEKYYNKLLDILSTKEYDEYIKVIRDQTSGVRSISKHELITYINDKV